MPLIQTYVASASSTRVTDSEILMCSPIHEVNKLNEAGKNAYKENEFQNALECFGKAIALETNNAVLHSNRAAVYIALSFFDSARVDAAKTVTLLPTWGTGRFRLAAALHGMGKLEASASAYADGLELDPGNKLGVEGLARVHAMLAKHRTASTTPSHSKPPACPMLFDKGGRDYSHRCCGNSMCLSFTGSGNGSTVTLKSCPCLAIEYCSKVCQKHDWQSHQVNCTTAKDNEDADWMTRTVREPGQKRPPMHGIKVVPSKCLECKRTITVAPEVTYDNFVCRFM